METAHAIGIVVNDRKMVENISELRPRTNLAATVGDAFHGWDVFHDPSHFVEAVHGLLGDVIAGEPSVVIPILDLILHVSPTGLAGEGGPDITGVVGSVESADFTNGAIVDLLHDGADAVVVAVTEAGDKGEIFPLGFFDSGEAAADAGGIRRHRFPAEDVLSRRDGGFQMKGAETGRRGENDNIDAAVDNFLVSVEADETFFGRDGDFLGMVGAKVFQAVLKAILESVAHCDQRDIFIGVESLAGRAGTAAAATNEANPKSVRVFFGEDFSRQDRGGCERAAE